LARTFVLPSFSESFPTTILEAMACGTPIIASEVGGIPEMVRNGLEGELFRPGDALDLSDRLERLRDEKKTILMSRRARERVEDHFTARQMAIRTAEFYNRVMEERN
jgi:glycosyltransferase involved in cell wall biosynthesis